MEKPVLRGFFYTATREEIEKHLSDGLHQLQKKGFPGVFEVGSDGAPIIKAWTLANPSWLMRPEWDDRSELGQEILIGVGKGETHDWSGPRMIVMPDPRGMSSSYSPNFTDWTITADIALVFMPDGPVELPEEYHCDKLVFSIANLSEWLRGHGNGFFTDPNTGRMDFKQWYESGEVNYKRPENIQVELPDGPRVSITFDIRLDFDMLEQRTWVRLEYDKPRLLNSAMEDMKKVQRFFQFAMNHASPVSECKVHSPEICDRKTDVLVCSPHELYESHSERSRSASMLFSYHDLQKANIDLKEVLVKWWSFYDKFGRTELVRFYDLLFDERPKYSAAAFNTLAPMLEGAYKLLPIRNELNYSNSDWQRLKALLCEKRKEKGGEKPKMSNFDFPYCLITQKAMRTIGYTPSDDDLANFILDMVKTRNDSMHGKLGGDYLASIHRIYRFTVWLLKLYMLDGLGASAFGPHIFQASNLYSLQRDMKSAGFPVEE